MRVDIESFIYNYIGIPRKLGADRGDERIGIKSSETEGFSKGYTNMVNTFKDNIFIINI